MSGKVRSVVWIAVGCGAVAGIAVAIILLRGDPTYLVQPKGGGVPAPISFPYRAFSVIILVASMIFAGMRAVSEDGLLWWPMALGGYALFVVNVILSPMVRPSFPQFILDAWIAVLLPVILYSEPIGEYLRGPPWLIWVLCLLGLAARIVWLAVVASSV